MSKKLKLLFRQLVNHLFNFFVNAIFWSNSNWFRLAVMVNDFLAHNPRLPSNFYIKISFGALKNLYAHFYTDVISYVISYKCRQNFRLSITRITYIWLKLNTFICCCHFCRWLNTSKGLFSKLSWYWNCGTASDLEFPQRNLLIFSLEIRWTIGDLVIMFSDVLVQSAFR